MRFLNLKRTTAKSPRRVAIFLLLAYFAMGAGLVDSSVLCLGEDGHLAIESAVSCAFCGTRTILPLQSESLFTEGIPTSGCGPCQDFSIQLAREFPGFALPTPPGSDMGVIALPSIEPDERFRTTIASVSSISEPFEIPDPIAHHTRTVVLLI